MLNYWTSIMHTMAINIQKVQDNQILKGVVEKITQRFYSALYMTNSWIHRFTSWVVYDGVGQTYHKRERHVSFTYNQQSKKIIAIPANPPDHIFKMWSPQVPSRVRVKVLKCQLTSFYWRERFSSDPLNVFPVPQRADWHHFCFSMFCSCECLD